MSNLRREDGGNVEELGLSSRKKVIFNCDVPECGNEYIQGFAEYNKQPPGLKLCYSCRRKEIASRPDVKAKQSQASKKMWEIGEHREKMSQISSVTMANYWNEVPKEERNPHNHKKTFENYQEYFSKFPEFTLFTTKEEFNSGDTLKFSCEKGHINETRKFELTKSKPPCKFCNCEIYIPGIEEELSKLGHILVALEDNKITIECEKGHIFSKAYSNWKLNKTCSVCNGKKSDNEVIKQQFNDEGFEVLNFYHFRGGIRRFKFSLKCKHEHEFEMTYYDFKNGLKCPECQRIEKYNEREKYAKSFGYKYLDSFEDFYLTFFNFECDKGHIGKMRWNNFKNMGQRCVECFSEMTVSDQEYEIRNILDMNNIPYIGSGYILDGKQLDIFIPEKNIGIEYNGIYWHCEYSGKKDKNYHLNKTNLCAEKGIRLIHIFSNEWNTKKDLVIKKLLSILGVSQEKKIFARNCVVKIIDSKTTKSFCEEYHIQGSGRMGKNLGLYEGEELVSVMTFTNPNISKGLKSELNNEKLFELDRFCSSCNVIGAAGKLLEHFKRNFEWDRIFTYADKRWSVGGLYKTLGFEYKGDTSPNYWYVHKSNLNIKFHRFKFRRSELEGEGTEWDIMKRNGYDRFWDCGHMKFELVK